MFFTVLPDSPEAFRQWRRLIVALSGSGRQAEAIEAYHDVRTQLRDELGLDPSTELQDLYRHLLNGQSVAEAEPAAQSPGGAWWSGVRRGCSLDRSLWAG